MTNILESTFIKECGTIADRMYQNGWHERNSGNISYILNEEEIRYVADNKVKETIDLQCEVKSLEGLYFMFSATGKYIKNISKDPERSLGIIKIKPGGKQADILWGFSDGGRPTSELSTHLLTHEVRLSKNPKHKVVIHAHTTNIMAMTFVHELEDRSFTRALWKMCTESIVVFPDGVGVLPWMLCGNERIGLATAEKMKNTRLVVWALHGAFGSGESFDDCLGLIETVEKSAQIYLMTANMKKINTLHDHQLIELAEAFKVDYRKDYLE